MNKKSRKKEKVFHYDTRTDSFYIGIKSGLEEEFIEIAPGINVEFNDNKEVIGIEILNASKIFKPVYKKMLSPRVAGITH